LKQIYSEPGKGPQDYGYNSRFFDVALDKFGQILKDDKMATISKQNDLAGRHAACGDHFPSISLPF
jgi:hypothetical protein